MVFTLDRLELFLSKVDKEMEWSTVVIGDSRGQRVFDAEQLALINEQLAPYTSDAIVCFLCFKLIPNSLNIKSSVL